VSQLAARALLERHGLLLPTEAQWEYACQAAKGQQPRRCNYFGNAEHVPRSVPVDAFEPGIWGLYNQHGNVAEMCRDVACQHFQMVSHAPGDGLLLWFWGAERAARGGSFYQDSDHAGAAFRTWRICHIGFPIDGVRPARAIQGRP
jgi:formylglycine-generating enzyme required for sulfatase activity